MDIEKERTGELLRVSCAGGKYTVIQTEDGRVSALRHGEEWMQLSTAPGSNLILALAQDLDDARKTAVEHEKDADAWTRVSMQIQHQKNKFGRALRWVFENGMHPDHSRPQHVNEAFNEAWEGHRANDPWAARLGEPKT